MVSEIRANTESFLSMRMNGGPGFRFAVTNGSIVQNATQKAERQRMMKALVRAMELNFIDTDHHNDLDSRSRSGIL